MSAGYEETGAEQAFYRENIFGMIQLRSLLFELRFGAVSFL